MAGCCECGDGPSDAIICGEFVDQLRICQRLKKDSAPRSYVISSVGTLVPLEVLRSVCVEFQNCVSGCLTVQTSCWEIVMNVELTNLTFT